MQNPTRKLVFSDSDLAHKVGCGKANFPIRKMYFPTRKSQFSDLGRKKQFSDSGNVFSDSEKPMRKMGSEIRSDAENEQIGVQNPTRIKLFPDSEIGVFRFGKCCFPIRIPASFPIRKI